MIPLLFDSGMYDSGPTIQAEQFRPDTIQACHNSGQLDTIQAHSARFRPVTIQACHDSGRTQFRPHNSGQVQFRPVTIQAPITQLRPVTIQARHDSGP